MTHDNNTVKRINPIARMEWLPVADTHYLLPRKEDWKVLSAIMVSEGEVVDVVKQVLAVVVESTAHSKDLEAHNSYDTVGESDDVMKSSILVEGDDNFGGSRGRRWHVGWQC